MADIKEAIESVLGKKKGKSLLKFELVHDAPTAQVEPIYFWLLDFLGQFVEGKDGSLEKVSDNFTSSPGSGHFSELGAKTTRMQEEGMKILGAINQVVKSILNLNLLG